MAKHSRLDCALVWCLSDRMSAKLHASEWNKTYLQNEGHIPRRSQELLWKSKKEGFLSAILWQEWLIQFPGVLKEMPLLQNMPSGRPILNMHFKKLVEKVMKAQTRAEKNKVSEFSSEGKTGSSVCLVYQKDDEEMNCSHYISILMGRQ